MTAWSGGAFGERGTCVLADNASPMTLDGTNTWVLREPGVSSAIVGASRPEQVEENVAASGIELPSDALARIDAVLKPVL